LTILCCIGDEGNWAWAHSHEFLKGSFWGTNKPNNRTGNSDDCCVMVLRSNGFWWEDRSCLVHDIQQHDVAPICQHDSTAASTTSEAPMTTTSFECPAGWAEFENHCYIAKTSAVGWTSAENSCLNLGSHLVSVHSRAEYDFVSGLQPSDTFWIGGKWSSSVYDWSWSDGTAWDYELWYSENSGSSALCIYIYSSRGFVSDYCSNSRAYVCKI
jgi:hypothetical protein